MDKKEKENRITKLIKEADQYLDQIFTRGTDSLLMTNARTALLHAYQESQKLTIIEEPENDKPMEK